MSCKHIVDESSLYCPHCGERQERTICQCLHVNPNYALFCTQCGFEFAQVNNSGEVKPSSVLEVVYDLDEIIEQAQLEPVTSSAVRDAKMSQEDINSLIMRKTKRHVDKK